MYVKKKREVATLREQKSTLLADWRKKKLKIYPPQKKKKENLDRNLESPGFQKQPSRACLDFRNEQFFTFKTQPLIERQLMTEGDSEKWGESQKGENLKRNFFIKHNCKSLKLEAQNTQIFFLIFLWCPHFVFSLYALVGHLISVYIILQAHAMNFFINFDLFWFV